MLTRVVRLRILLAVASLLAPVLAGSVIYYSLRKTHPRTADLANWMSFVSFFSAGAFVSLGWAQGDGRLIIAALVGLGILGAEVGIRLMRAAEYEIDQGRSASGAA